MSIEVLFNDGHGTAIRRSSVRQFDAMVSFAPVAIKSVMQGVEHYQFDRKIFKANPEKIIVGNFHSEARVLINSKQDVKGICIDFGKQLLDTYLKDLQFSDSFKTQVLEDQLFSGQLKSQSYLLQKRIIRLCDVLEDQNNNELILEQLTILLDTYFEIQYFRYINAHKLEFSKARTRLANADYILDAQFMLNNQLDQDLHLDTLASQIGVSKFHLIRLFKKSFGLTPHQYLIERRLNRALELLPKMPVNEVAAAIGFSDASSFGKAFKQKFGITPSLFKLK
jgi:AraC-like DNA-binding protein